MGPQIGCTIGAKILRPGREYVLFKNKDLRREALDDRLEILPDALGVLGLHLPPPGQTKEDVFRGYSVGLNCNGVCACNSHLRAIEGAAPYDELNREALMGTATAREALDRIVALAAKGQYDRGNILIADPNGVAVVEVASDVVWEDGGLVAARGNTHVLSHGEQVAASPCARLVRTREALSEAASLEDFFALLRSHEGERPVCLHTESNTVYSYVIHWVEGELTLYVCQGHPCQNDYARIPIRFPVDAEALAEVYPTGVLLAGG